MTGAHHKSEGLYMDCTVYVLTSKMFFFFVAGEVLATAGDGKLD